LSSPSVASEVTPLKRAFTPVPLMKLLCPNDPASALIVPSGAILRIMALNVSAT
jgi:hypothetical protein